MMNLNFKTMDMFNNKKFLFSVIFALTMLMAGEHSIAQPGDRNHRQSEKIEALKTRFFTRQMQLTPQEARLFWPLYDEYTTKQNRLREQRDELTPESSDAFDDMTDEEINKMIDDRLQQAETALEDRKKLINDLREILPPHKVARFLRAEHRFKIELHNRIQERRANQTRPGWN
jgi:hypothetical protein